MSRTIRQRMIPVVMPKDISTVESLRPAGRACLAGSCRAAFSGTNCDAATSYTGGAAHRSEAMIRKIGRCMCGTGCLRLRFGEAVP